MEAVEELQPDLGRSVRWRVVPAFLRNDAGLMVVLAVLLMIFAISVRLSDLGRGYGGYTAFSEPGVDSARPSYFTPAWWPAYEWHPDPLNLQLLQINGLPYTDNARDEYQRAAAAGEPQVILEAIYQNEPLTLASPVYRVTFAELLDLAIADTIIGVVFLLLGIEVLRARPGQEVNRAFTILVSVIAINRLAAGTTVFEDSRLAAVLIITCSVVAANHVGWSTYRFATVFPSPLRRMRRLWWPVYLLTLLNAALIVLVWLLWPSALPQQLRATLTDIYPIISLLLYGIGLVALVVRLVWSWFSERETKRQRRAAAIIIFGVAVAFPLLLRLGYVSLPGQNEVGFFLRTADLRYLFLAIPLCFAYVIIRYQTFRSPSPLFMFVLVFSFSAIISAFGIWGWDLSRSAAAPPARPPFTSLFLVILLTAGFWSLQASQRGWFGRFLNWERSSYDAARAFGRRVMSTAGAGLVEMPQTIAQALVDDLQLEQAAVWLWRPDAVAESLPQSMPVGSFELLGLAGAAANDAADYRLRGGLTGVGFRASLNTPVTLGPPRRIGEDDATPAALRPVARAGIEAIVPLESGGVPLGLLGLGKRWDEAIFDDRDLAIAELVGQQATLFLLAAQQVEQLRRVPAQITEAQEHERLSLARELHDTTQQFLGRLPFYLAISKSKVSNTPDEAIEMLDRSMNEAGDAAAELRRIRVNLAPNMLETSLQRPLQDLISHVRQRSGLVVELSAPAEIDAATTLETRHALYRVIQQALDNAVSHAAASHIAVAIGHEDGRVSFSVTDDGRGMATNAREIAAARGSFGLRSMRTRLESVGGGFEILSSEGQGTTILGWVPAA